MKYLIAFLCLFSLAFASESSSVKAFKKDESLFLNFKILELENNLNRITMLISSCKNETSDRIFDTLLSIQDDLHTLSYDIEGCKYLICELGFGIPD
jgi:hypothetical protein